MYVGLKERERDNFSLIMPGDLTNGSNYPFLLTLDFDEL